MKSLLKKQMARNALVFTFFAIIILVRCKESTPVIAKADSSEVDDYYHQLDKALNSGKMGVMKDTDSVGEFRVGINRGPSQGFIRVRYCPKTQIHCLDSPTAVKIIPMANLTNIDINNCYKKLNTADQKVRLEGVLSYYSIRGLKTCRTKPIQAWQVSDRTGALIQINTEMVCEHLECGYAN